MHHTSGKGVRTPGSASDIVSVIRWRCDDMCTVLTVWLSTSLTLTLRPVTPVNVIVASYVPRCLPHNLLTYPAKLIRAASNSTSLVSLSVCLTSVCLLACLSCQASRSRPRLLSTSSCGFKRLAMGSVCLAMSMCL